MFRIPFGRVFVKTQIPCAANASSFLSKRPPLIRGDTVPADFREKEYEKLP